MVNELDRMENEGEDFEVDEIIGVQFSDDEHGGKEVIGIQFSEDETTSGPVPTGSSKSLPSSPWSFFLLRHHPVVCSSSSF
ncbi:hypothetical protein M413DRAFT_195901 [Hebeloma cylindrosporum]|uniref:Uncharacterized protein n=1 Tax=Hebeloma cylindrosporum TaxID=76867 RepID=A0A0C2XNI7_HEBCY|nr:hypothetical protein M413DRAFT_195901 [Hebeloma cylindrosporum h7]